MNSAAVATIDRLDELRQRWWLTSTLCAFVTAITACIVVGVLLILADVARPFSRPALAVLLVAWLSIVVGSLGWAVKRAMGRGRSLLGAARRVESTFDELDNDLVNLLQFAGDSQHESDPFRQAAIARAARRVAAVPWQQTAQRHTRLERWRYALQTPRDLVELASVLAAAIVLAIGLACLVPGWSSAQSRLLAPWRFIPQVGSAGPIDVSPGSVEVPAGMPLTIAGHIRAGDGRRRTGIFYLTAAGGGEEPFPMLANAAGDSFSYAIGPVRSAFSYRLQVGDSQSEVFQVSICPRPAIESVEITYEFPAYTGRQRKTVRQSNGDLEAPQFTTAWLAVRSQTPLASGFARRGDREIWGQVGEDRHVLELRLVVNENANYTLHLVNPAGYSEEQPRVNAIRATPDAPPAVQLVSPPRESEVAIGDQVELAVRASDDYGLGAARLEWSCVSRSGDRDGDAAVLHEWTDLAGAAATTRAYAWPIDGGACRPGEELLVRAVAVDRRDVTVPGEAAHYGPQLAATPWHVLRVVDAESRAAQVAAAGAGLHERLWQVLRMQVRARASAADAIRQADLAKAVALANEVHAQQADVLAQSTDLARPAPTADAGMDALRRGLTQLVQSEMAPAVEWARRLSGAQSLPDVQDTGRQLSDVQDRIIQRLRHLLDASRASIAAAEIGAAARRGGDLPGEPQRKLAELHDKLMELLGEQKRVIEATADLAKTPVDDLSQEDQAQLSELAAVEDDWSRFLEEAHSDFSKLPEQDFANPSLLAELVEVQTELKLAEDALAQRAADIAVPLEQLGAEMAEELVSNIEKWLPDTPDRERWSQEEPLADDLKDAPLAELPGELEDLIGELAEEEEDLFDELEDVSSSWADSIDDGAGWDAMDGPISNMSAKGVTGNRLPNSSEIGGRSGEGRQGKSSGEFVADTAVGKGGRKTPTRLAPDPIVGGQVNDQSRDPVGGATGGGKESGQGGRGLEGPVPKDPQGELSRLAGKQADLRNRGEAIDLKFQVHNYHHTDLAQLIERMKTVEAELAAGRLPNALRQREALLAGLAQVKTYVAGELQVRKDESVNLPADVQKELLGGMQEPAPAGWEELNQRYFRRLTSEAAARPAPTKP